MQNAVSDAERSERCRTLRDALFHTTVRSLCLCSDCATLIRPRFHTEACPPVMGKYKNEKTNN